MLYLLDHYWPFLLLALAAGAVFGWLAAGPRAPKRVEKAEALEEIGP